MSTLHPLAITRPSPQLAPQPAPRPDAAPAAKAPAGNEPGRRRFRAALNTSVRRALRLAILLAMIAIPLAGCSSGSMPGRPAAAQPPPPADLAAELTGNGPLTVRNEPLGTAPAVTRLKARTALGSPTTLLVLGSRPGWVRVELPVRPNGSTGWVPASAVRLRPLSSQVHIDLAARRLRIVTGGRTVLDTPVAVGSPANPTPSGSFFVTDRVAPADPAGPYGSFALGLSAHSPTLTEFAGGDGQIGLHGTDAPASIGRAVSHGCVRLPADAVAALRDVPLGTPVLIA